MSRWKVEFEGHPIWDTIEQIGFHLETKFEETNSTWFTERRRLIRLVELFESTLEEMDAEVVPINSVTGLNANLTNHVLTYTAAFSTDGQIEHLQAANDHMTNFLSELAILRVLGRKSQAPKQTKTLNKLVDEFTRSISKKQTDLESMITESEDTIEQQKVKQSELETAIEAKKTETDTLIAIWQEQFGTAQTERQSAFDAQLKRNDVDTKENTDTVVATAERTLNKAITLSNQHITKRHQDANKKLKEILQDADEKHKSILLLFQIVAEDSASAGYAKNAKDEKIQADFWRGFSIIFILATAAWIFSIVYLNDVFTGGMVAWKAYPTMISLTFVLLLGAAYTAQQSTRHRVIERRNRWWALRVAAFEPFVSSLSDAQKNELRKEIASALFGEKENDERKDDSTTAGINALADLISRLIKIFRK